MRVSAPTFVDPSGVAYSTGGGSGGTSEPDIYKAVSMEVVKNAAAATVSSTNIIAPTLTATAANADDSTGPWLQHTSGAVAGNASGVISTAFTLFQRGWSTSGLFHCRHSGDTLAQRVWIGFFSGNPDASATPSLHLAAFRYDTAADLTAFWRCVTAAGTATQTVTETTVAVTANAANVFRIDMRPNDVKFYINITLVATHTTNLPTATQGLGWAIRVVTLAALAEVIRWRRVAFRIPN